jgi:hypothetical protein
MSVKGVIAVLWLSEAQSGCIAEHLDVLGTVFCRFAPKEFVSAFELRRAAAGNSEHLPRQYFLR